MTPNVSLLIVSESTVRLHCYAINGDQRVNDGWNDLNYRMKQNDKNSLVKMQKFSHYLGRACFFPKIKINSCWTA